MFQDYDTNAFLKDLTIGCDIPVSQKRTCMRMLYYVPSVHVGPLAFDKNTMWSILENILPMHTVRKHVTSDGVLSRV